MLAVLSAVQREPRGRALAANVPLANGNWSRRSGLKDHLLIEKKESRVSGE